CFGHRSSSILKTCPNHFNSFSSILSITLSSASIMFLMSLFLLVYSCRFSALFFGTKANAETTPRKSTTYILVNMTIRNNIRKQYFMSSDICYRIYINNFFVIM
ncbi:hypothetical protein L9F63_017339, partial [Diploptera punctata]